MADNKIVRDEQIIATSTDPVYIGTGGYTIGRVDNTIVRDPITKLPKIPGTSIAGTWRYFMTIDIVGKFKEEPGKMYRSTLRSREGKDFEDLWVSQPENKGYKPGFGFEGNRYLRTNCAGQDNMPNETSDDARKLKTGSHCGRCIVCKSFGYAKRDKAEQGLISFTDLNILLFPVYTRLGTKWITTKKLLKETEFLSNENKDDIKLDHVIVDKSNDNYKDLTSINLGWLYLPVKKEDIKLNKDIADIDKNDIIIVPESLLSQIVNSNLEVRTSVSIDPNTGAAKSGALFTSEAIPRATVFYSKVYIFNRNKITAKNNNAQPSSELIMKALKESKTYFETLGIGGMTTRGFGRMKIDGLEKTSGGNSGTTESEE